MNSDDRTTQLDEPIIAKRALLEKRLLEAGTKSSALYAITRRIDREFAPLSFSERRLWLLNQLEPKRPASNHARILQLTNPRNSKVLERLFIAIIDRRDTLQTTFATAVGSTIAVRDLRCFLQRKLADDLASSAFVFLDSLPLTPNGKVDRKALPAPDRSRPELKDAFTAPRTPVEKVLASIWSDFAKLAKVGIHDNFFQLGGRTVLATRVDSRICEALKHDLPLRNLFEAPTIEGLARKLQDLRDKHEVARTAPLLPSHASNVGFDHPRRRSMRR